MMSKTIEEMQNEARIIGFIMACIHQGMSDFEIQDNMLKLYPSLLKLDIQKYIEEAKEELSELNPN